MDVVVSKRSFMEAVISRHKLQKQTLLFLMRILSHIVSFTVNAELKILSKILKFEVTRQNTTIICQGFHYL